MFAYTDHLYLCPEGFVGIRDDEEGGSWKINGYLIDHRIPERFRDELEELRDLWADAAEAEEFERVERRSEYNESRGF